MQQHTMARRHYAPPYTMQQKMKNVLFLGSDRFFWFIGSYIITEMDISFDLKMLFRFSETIFYFWPRNLVFGPPCPV